MEINKIEDLYSKLNRTGVEGVMSDVLNESINSILVYGWSGIDDLDKVEILMKIEMEFDVAISDDLAETIFESMTLSDFLSGISAFNRNSKIDSLGI